MLIVTDWHLLIMLGALASLAWLWMTPAKVKIAQGENGGSIETGR